LSLATPTIATGSRSDLNLASYIDVIRRRRTIFIQMFVMVVAIGLVVTALSKPVYQSYATIMVPTTGANVGVFDAKDPIAMILATARPEPIKTQVQILNSEPFQSEARKLAKITDEPGVVPPAVSVEPLEGMNVIRVVVEGGDPKAITTLANTVVDLHLKKTDLTTTTGIEDTKNFTKQERDRLARELKTAERALINFRKSHQDVLVAAAQDAKAQEYIQLQGDVHAAEANLRSARIKRGQLEARLASEQKELVQTESKPNPRIERLASRLDDLRFQRDDLLRKYQPTHRLVTDLVAQITALEGELATEPKELETRSRVPNPQRAALQSQLAELDSSQQTFETAYNDSKAQLDAKRKYVDNSGLWQLDLSRLTTQRDRIDAELAKTETDLRELEVRSRVRIRTGKVIEAARVPTAPIRPKKSTNLLLTVVLAVCLAAAMAFLQEFLDDRVNAPADLERFSSVPALGHVPSMEDGSARLLSSLPANSHAAESYRALRSTIGFASIDTPLRRLLVTSSSKGEGKSVTSVNLATAMAMDGKRVILVDADLRRPNIHRLIQLPLAPGLSEVLVGMKSLDEAIQPTEVENLRVVCAGPIPPNPAELLNSRAFDVLLEQLEERADIVIFDSPPCIPVTDPLIIANRMDGVVLVLQVGQTRKAAVRHAQELLERAHARVIGVVFNRVHQRKSGYYYYYNYYYTADGYYAEDDRKGRPGRNGKGPRPKLAAGEPVKPRSWQVKNDDDV
jgi:tyrosine-protein kinase Etk/Wzc